MSSATTAASGCTCLLLGCNCVAWLLLPLLLLHELHQRHIEHAWTDVEGALHGKHQARRQAGRWQQGAVSRSWRHATRSLHLWNRGPTENGKRKQGDEGAGAAKGAAWGTYQAGQAS